jgi:hypothetical protein
MYIKGSTRYKASKDLERLVSMARGTIVSAGHNCFKAKYEQ